MFEKVPARVLEQADLLGVHLGLLRNPPDVRVSLTHLRLRQFKLAFCLAEFRLGLFPAFLKQFPSLLQRGVKRGLLLEKKLNSLIEFFRCLFKRPVWGRALRGLL